VTSLDLQIGPNAVAGTDTYTITTPFTDTSAVQLGINTMSVMTAANSSTAITSLDTAIDTITGKLSTIGNTINALEGTVTTLQLGKENYSAAEARIRATDVARETSNMTRFQIMQNAAASMLSQANQNSYIALQLIGSNN
jgi:flagellin